MGIAFISLLNNGDDPEIFPSRVRLQISNKLIEVKDKREIWKIAGNGWKTQMEEHVRSLLENFHSPRTAKVDTLFESTIGYKNISKQWTWGEETCESVADKLNRIISIRGKIAHEIYSQENLSIEINYLYMKFIYRVAGITNDVLRNFIFEKTGKYIFEVSGWEKE